jgi:S-DNA-T family DNA segregation ATPase FtsK/SpoIIIE
MMSKRPPRVAAGLLGLLWFPAMGVCIYASVSFVQSPEFSRTFAHQQSVSSAIHAKEVERGRVKQAMEDDEGDMGYETRDMNQRLLVALDAEIRRLRSAPAPLSADAQNDQWTIVMGLGAIVLEIFSAAGLVLVGTATPMPPSFPPGSAGTPFSGGSLSSPMSGSSPMAGLPGVSPSAQLAGSQPLALLGSRLSEPQPKPQATPDQQARKLERALANHGIRGRITGITGDGPVVTRYAFRAAQGTKVAKVVGLSDELALELEIAAISITPTPEDGVICFELPKPRRRTVEIETIYASAKYQDPSVALPLAIGVDVSGRPIVADLADMPHLLIAGTTGSGKSVGINAMIMSLLNRLTPDQCRFIMIDPKMLELSIYEGIPHLLAPVVTDMSKAILALNWIVREMDQRYAAMTRERVRGLKEYNARMLEPDQLPFIVVVIDEFADLMLTTGKDVERAVQRIAQKARAAGIHLIMATQRPSTDVITGIIKANFPSRLSYNVANRHDADVIGLPGAQNLLGRGDLLFQLGGGRVIRAHGPYVSSSYVNGVVESLKSNSGDADYIDLGGGSDEEDSPVFDRGESGDAEFGTQRGDKIKRAALWLEMMLSENGPMSSTELYEAAAAEEPPISKTSIFEVSKRMKVRKANPDGGFKAGQSQIWSM